MPKRRLLFSYYLFFIINNNFLSWRRRWSKERYVSKFGANRINSFGNIASLVFKNGLKFSFSRARFVHSFLHSLTVPRAEVVMLSGPSIVESSLIWCIYNAVIFSPTLLCGFSRYVLEKKIREFSNPLFFQCINSFLHFFLTIYRKKINKNSLVVVSLYTLAGFHMIYLYYTNKQNKIYY